MPSARLALVVALCLASAARADEAWQPLLAQDGVRVEERSAPGRELPELRGTVEIDAAIFEVLAVIADIPRQKEWINDCKESRLIREDGPDIALIYNRTAAPWPVSDRDAVLHTQLTLLAPSAHATVSFANATDPGTPPIEGVVRMPRLVGEYDLVAVTPTRTRVVYQVDIDPGGSVPGWVTTRTTRETALNTLLGLRRQVAATRGMYGDFVASWSARR